MLVIAYRIGRRYPLVVFQTFVVTALVADNPPKQPPNTNGNDQPQ
jgi:hypothetical protein